LETVFPGDQSGEIDACAAVASDIKNNWNFNWLMVKPQ